MQSWDYAPSRTPLARVKRRLVQSVLAAPAEVRPDRAVVSFTFDDFPKSALTGADIVEAAGGRAGFYACTSVMGKRSPILGEMFDSATIAELSARGHEIGAHTHDHADCAQASLDAIERSVGDNLVRIADAGYQPTVSAFAYPYGETTFAAKQWLAHVFATSRGIRPGVNHGRTDRAQLRATELLDNAASRRRASEQVKKCLASNGWLILFTHDVSPTPSAYGVPPDLIADLVAQAVDGGAVLAAPTLAAVLSGVID
jgi:peptidoglycan/xylan/chitin deacetylase (PgdA/CDA1 family)